MPPSPTPSPHHRPSLDTLAVNTLFDPTLSIITRFALATFFAPPAGIVVYTTVDAMYHFATLVGRLILRQPVWQFFRPPFRLFRTSTSTSNALPRRRADSRLRRLPFSPSSLPSSARVSLSAFSWMTLAP
ncbi:hypothetical protein BC827DRAFT_723795 [Russula dissimulans]|nr:hypothetical protein BC827DRAFT_723795 [Russula dissimulans]